MSGLGGAPVLTWGDAARGLFGIGAGIVLHIEVATLIEGHGHPNWWLLAMGVLFALYALRIDKLLLPLIYRYLVPDALLYLGGVFSRNARKTIAHLQRVRSNDSTGTIRRLLLTYGEQEFNALRRQTVSTTFANYADMVKNVVEDHVKKHGARSTVCLSQNTIDFVKWFNFSDNGRTTHPRWLEYITTMNKLVKQEVSFKRFFAFTDSNVRTEYPYIRVTSGAGKECEAYMARFASCRIYTPTSDTVFDTVLRSDKPLSLLRLSSAGDQESSFLKFWRTHEKSLFVCDESGKTAYENMQGRMDCEGFIVACNSPYDAATSSHCSLDVVHAYSKLFNPKDLYALYLNQDRLDHLASEHIPDDFFAIGQEVNGKPVWKMILAADTEVKSDMVRLTFLTESSKEVTGANGYNWQTLERYINTKLCSDYLGTGFCQKLVEA